MRRCFSDDVAEEWHIKTHWMIILQGNRGAGMFNHTDTLQTSSWHAHIEGTKWWIVCGKNEGVGDNEGNHECFEDIMQVGDVLYYPRNWAHQTQNLEFPTTTLTGTVVNSFNWFHVSQKIYGECTQGSMNFHFSGKMCDQLDACINVWAERFQGRSTSPFKPWREVATPDEQAKRDSWKSSDHNYDGRNSIAE